ncbi:DEAD/DEAH box helicase [Sutterella sp.]|uniref:DEAD/DEAH box helicase n=1 Tax=Sutterella sp. TaxID=1981025 RepID=UPI0026E0795C|nr:DEAD/DEAH box helicase [Sutterella sp.]MDO5532790.1 DEAD/DEAH box helicase [Sutterella sp.]
MSDVFARYAPFVQDFIYRNGWERLRSVQVAAGEAIFSSDAHVLLTASTASGKTEAAFFPILTLLAENPPASIGCLYVAPLKALINDQFGRLTELCEEGGIKVTAWHGDVGQSRKDKLMRHPSGILQITPESLEALLLHRHAAIPSLFCDLRFIVIDEIHSLLRGDRGMQTMCLIERLSRLSGADPRRIGLSATIGDPEAAAAFLRGCSKRPAVVPRFTAPAAKARLSIGHWFVAAPLDAEPPAVRPEAMLEAPESAAPSGADPALGFIYEQTRGRNALVFTNSREECEAVTSELHDYCRRKGEPDRFFIHHGNLSKAVRSDAEAAMKDEETVKTICATATLELGIDVGRLERAFQIDAPFTVSGFLQRLGRTGRRGQPAEMHFVIREEEPEARAQLPATLPWKLLQACALIECARAHWVEPPRLDVLPFSLLYHQTMTTLAGEGEMTPAELAQRILTLSPFHRISKDDYRRLLKHLIATDQIERTERGSLIVGLMGERQLASYRFYAVFQENEEFAVRTESRELGTLVRPPAAGGKVAIAGHVWEVEEVDIDRHVVWVKPVMGRVPAFFGLCAGDIHTHVLETMCQVLRSDELYRYLQPPAAARLAEAREYARRAGIDRFPLVRLGEREWCLFPWLGTYGFLAMERLLKLKCAKSIGLSDLDTMRPYYMIFRMKTDAPGFFRALANAADELDDPMELLFPGEIPVFAKYDAFVPGELVRKGFALGVLGVAEMKARIRHWAGRAGRDSGGPGIIEDASVRALSQG